MPQKKQTYLLLFVFSVGYSSNAQLTFFGDLFISEGSERPQHNYRQQTLLFLTNPRGLSKRELLKVINGMKTI
ncbi:MAG: hypothetical protein PVK01_03945, partial [Flavobacteriaceae bacterium]|jgi:hypothetical protein